MAESALIRHLVAKVSMDTAAFQAGARRARSESQNLHQSFKRTFGRGIDSLEVLSKTLRGGAIVGGMAAIAAKAVDFYAKWEKVNEAVKQTPGLMSNAEAATLAVFQSLPLIGQHFDISEEVKASTASIDAFFSSVDKLRTIRRSSDVLFLGGSVKEAKQLQNTIDGMLDSLNALKRTALANNDRGLLGSIDKEIERLKSGLPFLQNLASKRPIIDEIKKASDAAANFGLTEKDIAVKRLKDLKASEDAIKELERAYDKLETKTRRQKDTDTAKGLAESVLTPKERLQKDLDEWMRLYNRELITGDVLSRLVAGRFNFKQVQATLPDLAVRGSQQAESLISRQMVGKTEKTQEEMLKEIMKIVRESKNSTDLLKQIEKKLGGVNI